MVLFLSQYCSHRTYHHLQFAGASIEMVDIIDNQPMTSCASAISTNCSNWPHQLCPNILFLLKNARLVKARKDGRWMYYRLNRDQDASEIVIQALKWIIDSLLHEQVIRRIEKNPSKCCL
jgi:DNA-binding transcriptional ArsR family regulator